MIDKEFNFYKYNNENEIIEKVKHIYAEKPLTVINWLYRLEQSLNKKADFDFDEKNGIIILTKGEEI